MKELRKHPRYMVRGTIQAINMLTGRSIGVLINLSAGGFMLMCGKDAPHGGDILQLHLLDPKEGRLDVIIGASCVWREEASATDSYWAGFKFIDVSPEAGKALDLFLEKLARQAQGGR